MGELDSRYVDEAVRYKKKARKPRRLKWGVVAACLALVLFTAVLRKGLLRFMRLYR